MGVFRSQPRLLTSRATSKLRLAPQVRVLTKSPTIFRGSCETEAGKSHRDEERKLHDVSIRQKRSIVVVRSVVTLCFM